MAFWIVAGIMAFGVGAALLAALRRGLGTTNGGAANGGTRPSVLRDQLAEIEAGTARGLIEADEAQRLRAELGRRALEAGRQPEAALTDHPRALPIAGGLVLAALAGALGLYLRLGAPDYPDLPLTKRLALAEAAYAARPSQADAEAAFTPAPVTADPAFVDLVAQLRAALATRPGDIKGLTLLARNEAALGNFAASAQAYRALIAAKGGAGDATDHLGAAEAMIAAAQGMVSAEAEAHLTQVLARDPSNRDARYFSGLMFAQTGRPDRAFALWEPLLTGSGAANTPWAEPLRAFLPQVAEAAGIKYTPPDVKGPSSADVSAAGEMSAEDRSAMIGGMVEGLEGRLMAAGGPLEDWLKLLKSLAVLGEDTRLQAAKAAALAAFAGDPAALAALKAAAP